MLKIIKNIFLLSLFFLFVDCDQSSQSKNNSNSMVSVKVFSSLTCPHCADFHGKIFEKLEKEYIKSGKVKFELRPFVLNAVDLNAFKLLHSVDEKDFLQLDKMLFKDQGKWFIIKSTNEESIKQSTEALKRYALLFGLSESEFEDILNDKELEDFHCFQLDIGKHYQSYYNH